jgi:hypothetical protein
MASASARFEYSGPLPVGRPETLVYVTHVDNEEALHQGIVDACHTLRNCSGFHEWMQLLMMRRGVACIESDGGHFEHIL